MTYRRPRLTARDIENINFAMQFVLAGEWDHDDPSKTDAENEEDHRSFKRTAEKIWRS